MSKTIPLPPSYALIHERGLLMLLKYGYRDLLIQQGIADFNTFLKKYGQTSPHLRGRTPLLSVLLKGGEKMVIRSYSHGGLLRGITRYLYLSGSRSFQELALTEEIRSSGIPTVQPIGAVHHRIFPFFYRAYLLTLEIPEAEDLPRYLLRMGSHPSPENLIEKRETIRSVGRLIQQFHRTGFYHRDLQLKNILVAGSSPLLIDFDRCYRKKVLTLKDRIRNILRLNRSVEKWKRIGIPLSRTDRWRFFLAYSEGDQKVKKALKKELRTHVLWFFIHRWTWGFGFFKQ
jgi:3-deoxy-D-manno-octulosonic acid kinase